MAITEIKTTKIAKPMSFALTENTFLGGIPFQSRFRLSGEAY